MRANPPQAARPRRLARVCAATVALLLVGTLWTSAGGTGHGVLWAGRTALVVWTAGTLAAAAVGWIVAPRLGHRAAASAALPGTVPHVCGVDRPSSRAA